MPDSTRITAAEFGEVSACATAQKALCQSHGVDWRRLVKEGVAVTELRALRDPLVDEMVDRVLALREARHGQ